jgi:hypothetical protein
MMTKDEVKAVISDAVFKIPTEDILIHVRELFYERMMDNFFAPIKIPAIVKIKTYDD